MDSIDNKIDFTKPNVAFRVSPDVFEKVYRAFPDYEDVLITSHYSFRLRDGRNKPRNEVLLDALGEYKDQVLAYAESCGRGIVRSVDYCVRTKSVFPESAQIKDGWHRELDLGQLALITASILPTKVLYTPPYLSDDRFQLHDYLIVERKAPGYEVFDDNSIDQGIADGVFGVFRAEPGEVYEIGTRIHSADENKTHTPIERVFIATDITFL